MGEGKLLASGTFSPKADNRLRDRSSAHSLYSPLQMHRRELKLKVGLYEEEASEQLHQVSFPAVAAINYGNNCRIVATRHHLLTTPQVTPDRCCNDYWQQLLHSDLLRYQGLVPLQLKPVEPHKSPQPHEPEASEGNDTGHLGNEQGDPFPVCKHFLSHKVRAKFMVQPYVMVRPPCNAEE